jgi:porin
MGVGDDFAAFSCDFQNLTFCGSPPGNIVGYYIYNWPISQWASRVKFDLNSFYLQVGAYDQNRKYLGERQALLPAPFPHSTGILTIAELGWLPKIGNGMLPGSYKFGGWYSTTTADDVVLDVKGTFSAITGLPPRLDRGLYGAYINFQQQITRTSTTNSDTGLSVFLNAVIADRKTAVTDFQIAAGLVYKGPFSLRLKDDIALAVGTTHVNSRLGDVQALQNALGLGPVGVQHFEYVFEAYYTFVVADGLFLRPNVQYIVDPGGVDQNKDVIVIGLKTSATL